jgi:hypothetical protein
MQSSNNVEMMFVQQLCLAGSKEKNAISSSGNFNFGCVVFHEATIILRASLNISGGWMPSGDSDICLILGGSPDVNEVVLLTAEKPAGHLKDIEDIVPNCLPRLGIP